VILQTKNKKEKYILKGFTKVSTLEENKVPETLQMIIKHQERANIQNSRQKGLMYETVYTLQA
jgi:hypothetical protein